MTIKILNLYAGLGGNRKLWEGDIKVTAIEKDPKIAKVHKELFPQDEVIVTDAHEYLLDHFKEFDFIWSSPPCPTHSDIRRCGVNRGIFDAMYPEMSLYQEIILLKHFATDNCKWVVENVIPYYEPLIRANRLGRHLFWSNYPITDTKQQSIREVNHDRITSSDKIYGFDVADADLDDKRKTLRNLVDPKIGLHIFNMAFKNKQEVLL